MTWSWANANPGYAYNMTASIPSGNALLYSPLSMNSQEHNRLQPELAINYTPCTDLAPVAWVSLSYASRR